MKKIITVLFLCSTLIVSAQKVLEFDRVDLLHEPIQVFNIESVFIVEPEKFTLLLANVKETYTIISKVKEVEVEGHDFFAFLAKSKSSGEELIVYFKKDNTGVVMVKEDKTKAAAVFYNK